MYQPDEARLRKFWHTLQEVWLRLYTLKVPLASAINGHAPAAGTLMATCSDYRVMVGSNPKFTMGLNEAKFGLVAPFWYASFFKKFIVLFFYAIYVCTLKKLFIAGIYYCFAGLSYTQTGAVSIEMTKNVVRVHTLCRFLFFFPRRLHYLSTINF